MTDLIIDRLARDMPAEIADPSRVKSVLYRAKHFVMDEEASGFVARMATTHVSLLNELREFAIPPFDTMAITHRYGIEPNDLVSFQSLTLWDQGEFKLLVLDEASGRLAVIPGWANVSREDFAIRMDRDLLGSDPEKVLGNVRQHYLMIEAFFLLMAQPQHYQINFNKARKHIDRGRVVNFYARSEIKLNLTGVPQFRRGFYTGARGSPRRHDVRRHFRHYGGLRTGCIHEWEPVEREDGKHRWQCGCGRLRVETGPFGRGDANKGFVRQSYAVTADRPSA